MNGWVCFFKRKRGKKSSGFEKEMRLNGIFERSTSIKGVHGSQK